jgi:hypothetical protein
VTDLTVFREYEPHELGEDGYPYAWHDGVPLAGHTVGVKHLVRAEAGDRCERCRHPYRSGESVAEGGANWSPCDERCGHSGRIRWRRPGDSGWVEERDADRFAMVGLLHNGEVEAAWRILTVHHLNGRKYDLRWWNLAALCQRCHLVIQRKVQMERIYPLEHSGWFKIHAAGWYSYAYEGVNITRENASDEVDRLLALERVA